MPEHENPYPASGELSQELDAISGRLVAARKNAEALAEFPGQLPESLEDAYAVQAASIARWPDEVAGWKVASIPASFRERLAAERLAGPVFESLIFKIESGASKTMPIYSGGFGAVEAEFVLQLATTIEPIERDYSDEELIELVSAVHIGAEIASSPMAMVNELGPCSVVSDFGNNAGILVGPSVPDWSTLPLESLTAAVEVDGVVVGSANAKAIEGGLLHALRCLISICENRGIVLKKGMYVSSGAVTGVHDVHAESKAKIDFGPFGSINVVFESMTPKQ